MTGLDSLKQFQAFVSVSLHVSTEINLVEKQGGSCLNVWVLAHGISEGMVLLEHCWYHKVHTGTGSVHLN